MPAVTRQGFVDVAETHMPNSIPPCYREGSSRMGGDPHIKGDTTRIKEDNPHFEGDERVPSIWVESSSMR